MSGLYPDVARAENIRHSFQGKTIISKYAGSVCKRCGCVIVKGTQIVWSLNSGGAHMPNECPPLQDRDTWKDWAKTLRLEQRVLNKIDVKPLAVLTRLEQIEEELAAGYQAPKEQS